MRLYRYESLLCGHACDDEVCSIPDVSIQLVEFFVVKETPKGMWIRPIPGGRDRFMLSKSRNRYAAFTKEAALESFIRRKLLQIDILQRQLNIASAAKSLAESMRGAVS